MIFFITVPLFWYRCMIFFITAPYHLIDWMSHPAIFLWLTFPFHFHCWYLASVLLLKSFNKNENEEILLGINNFWGIEFDEEFDSRCWNCEISSATRITSNGEWLSAKSFAICGLQIYKKKIKIKEPIVFLFSFAISILFRFFTLRLGRFQPFRTRVAFHLIHSTGWWIGSAVSLNKILNCRNDSSRLRRDSSTKWKNKIINSHLSFLFWFFTYDAGFGAGAQQIDDIQVFPQIFNSRTSATIASFDLAVGLTILTATVVTFSSASLRPTTSVLTTRPKLPDPSSCPFD